MKKSFILCGLCILLFSLMVSHLSVLVWVVFVPMLLVGILEKSWRRKSILFVMVSLVCAGYASWFVLLYGKMEFAAVLILIASFFFLFFMLSSLALRKIPYPLNALVPGMVWLLLQYLYSFAPIGSSFATLAIFAPMLAPLIWVVKAMGITYLIITFNALLAVSIAKKKRSGMVAALGIAILLIMCFLFSSFSQPSGERMKVALIQANIQYDWESRVALADKGILEEYIRLTKDAGGQDPSLVVWPEYAIAADLRTNLTALEKIRQLAREQNITIVLGTLHWEEGMTNGKKNKKDIAMAVFPSDKPSYEYAALIPLPLEPHTLPGDGMGLIEIDGKTMGMTMCYEETQLWLGRALRKDGAGAFVSLANNLAFTKSRVGLRLSGLYSRLSAAENGVYVLRSTNTGETYVANPYGKVVAKASSNKRQILISEVFIR